MVNMWYNTLEFKGGIMRERSSDAKYLLKEGVVDDMYVRFRQRVDSTGRIRKIETQKQIDMVKVECFYKENNSAESTYLKQMIGNYPNKNQMAQISLLDNEDNVYKTYQIIGIKGFRRKGILRCTDVKGAEYIDISNDNDLLNAIKFIRGNFDDFTIDFVNLNLKQINRTHTINVTPFCVTKLMRKLAKLNEHKQTTDCCCAR